MIDDLFSRLVAAKERERKAVEERRDIEDAITKELNVDTGVEFSKTITRGFYKMKVETRINRKVDEKRLMEVAKANKIGNDILQQLFRWKPEQNMREWKAAPTVITNVLAQAVTTSAGRPSISIKVEEE